MKKLRSNFSYNFLWILLISVLWLSCNKNEELGMNVQPQENMLGVTFIDSLHISAHTVLDDSVKTDETSSNIIGSLVDPVFGLTTAGMYAQFRLTTDNVDFGDNPVCDSIFLSLAYNSFYGDTTTNLTLNVFEITDDFYLDNSYYSNDVLGTFKNNLANINFIPSFRDSVKIDGANSAPQLRMQLKNSLGQKFIDASGSSDLADNTNFLKYFKGLYISTNSVTTKGVMLYINSLSSLSKLTMYYHNATDTLKYTFVLNANCARFNTFYHHKYATANSSFIQQVTSDSTLGDSLLYLQAMSGTRVKLKFPEVINLNNLGNIAINKAELVIKVDPTTVDDILVPPSRLSLAINNYDETLSFLPDVVYGETYYGGTYNSTTNEYRFNISKYIQNALLKGSFGDDGLILIVSGSAVLANRAVIFGPKHSNGGMHLDIIYTQIK